MTNRKPKIGVPPEVRLAGRKRVHTYKPPQLPLHLLKSDADGYFKLSEDDLWQIHPKHVPNPVGERAVRKAAEKGVYGQFIKDNLSDRLPLIIASGGNYWFPWFPKPRVIVKHDPNHRVDVRYICCNTGEMIHLVLTHEPVPMLDEDGFGRIVYDDSRFSIIGFHYPEYAITPRTPRRFSRLTFFETCWYHSDITNILGKWQNWRAHSPFKRLSDTMFKMFGFRYTIFDPYLSPPHMKWTHLKKKKRKRYRTTKAPKIPTSQEIYEKLKTTEEIIVIEDDDDLWSKFKKL